MITLELSNIGKIPITLYPGLRIAQLIFHTIESTNKEENSLVDENNIQNEENSLVDKKNIQNEEKKYIFNIGPKSSRILRDKDVDYFIKK